MVYDAATVEAWGYAETSIGFEIPNRQPAIHCPQTWPPPSGIGYYCSTGAAYNVDCEAPGGSKIRSNTDHNALWSHGVGVHGALDKTKQCSPTYGGGGDDDGGGGGGGGPPTCYTYIIERSDDGGETWYEVDRFTLCD